jgi:hypothetical protein
LSRCLRLQYHRNPPSAPRRCSPLRQPAHPLHDGSCPTAPLPNWPRIPPAESTPGSFPNRHGLPRKLHMQGAGWVTALPAAIKGHRCAPRLTLHRHSRTPLLPKHSSAAAPSTTTSSPPPPEDLPLHAITAQGG